MANQIVTNELIDGVKYIDESEDEYPFPDLYAGLRKIDITFAEKAVSFSDSGICLADIKETWDFFWQNSQDETSDGWNLLRFLDEVSSWHDLKKYMLSASAGKKDKVSCQKQIKSAMVSRQQEKSKELDLLFWLESSGHQVERQVKVGKDRLDLWIPGKLILELKTGRVNANDACQAIGYYSSCRRQICLIGASINESATKAIDAVNNLLGQECIVFVPWIAVKPYLASRLKDN